MSGDSMSIWFVSIKRVTFAREDLKRSYDLPQYCTEIIDILYTLDSASNYSAIQKLKPKKKIEMIQKKK
jgi:hypothetical protein